jgi:6-phosphogluconolactonase
LMAAKRNIHVAIGTYTEQLAWTVARGKGIHVLDFDLESGKLTPLSVCDGVRNPAYLTLSRDRKTLFAVSERADGVVTAHAVDKSSQEVVKRAHVTRSTGGDDPCHIVATAKLLMTTNYMSGSVAVFPVLGDAVFDRIQLVQHSGKSVHPQRQGEAHTHTTVIQDGHAYVVDLGMDKILRYAIDDDNLSPLRSVGEGTLPPGTGPRTLVFDSGKRAFVTGELNSTVNVLRDNASTVTQSVSTLPVASTHVSHPSHIQLAPSGKFLVR